MKFRVNIKNGDLFLGMLLLLAQFSCKKNRWEGPTLVYGQVLNGVTWQAVPDAEVFLVSRDRGCMSALCYKTLDYTRADAEGNFSFHFDAEDGRTYELRARAGDNFLESASWPYFTGGGKQRKDVVLEPYGTIGLELINEPPKDTISIYIWGDFLGQEVKLPHFSSDTLLYIKGWAGKEANISFRLLRNGIFKYEYHKVYVDPYDTSNLIMKY